MESSHASTASIRIQAGDQRSYCFSTSHYLDALIETNADHQPNAPPQRLTLRFTTGEAVILGSGLERIEERLAESHLRGLKTVEPRHASLLKIGPIIFSITVTRKDEV